MISFNPNYLLKTQSPDIVILGVKASTYEFWEDAMQSIASICGKIASLYGIHVFNFSRYFQIALQNGCNNLDAHQQAYR